MSDATRALQKLNLDDMPVTRSHSRPSQQGRGRERPTGESARMNPMGRPSRPQQPQQQGADPSPLVSQAGRMPGTVSLAPPATTPPIVQAQAFFKVEGIVREDTHIDFRLSSPDEDNRQVIERLFYDSAHRNHAAACSQAEHQRSRSPCNHIKWLVASLTRELLDPAAMEPTTSFTIQNQIDGLYPLIARQTKSLRTRLNTFRGGETDDESDSSDAASDDASQSSSAANIFARQNELCDILASFHDTMLPEDFRRTYVEGTPTVTRFEQCLVENNLYATLYRLGMRDRYIYRALQRLVPGNTRATRYYQKQEGRAMHALQALDQYSRSGTLDPRTSVPECARTLREIVHEVYEDLQRRFTRSSVDRKVGEQCAACLVRLVEEVVKQRYRDFYENYRDVPRGMPQRNRSIYAYLISERPTDQRLESWLRDLFVIDRLAQTPWMKLYDRLDTIMNDIRECTRDEPEAINYTDRIGRLLGEYNQTFDDPSSSANQPRMPRPE